MNLDSWVKVAITKSVQIKWNVQSNQTEWANSKTEMTLIDWELECNDFKLVIVDLFREIQLVTSNW